MLRVLQRLVPLVSMLSLLVGLTLLGSLWHEARQTRQLLLALVARDGTHTHFAMQAHMHDLEIIRQLHDLTAVVRAPRAEPQTTHGFRERAVPEYVVRERPTPLQGDLHLKQEDRMAPRPEPAKE
jgi:hypothetical protein